MKSFYLCFLVVTALTSNGQFNTPISDKGNSLKAFYLGLHVESLWISGQHVNWENGESDKPDAEQDIHTHCSSFVAAACKRLHIYLLRPPEHKLQLLASAQYDWLLAAEGNKAGWILLNNGNRYEAARQLANKGYVVIAAYKNSDPKKPGHIALVRPSEISREKIAESGPMLISAGTHNFNYISLKAAFRSHITEWPEQEILFFYHPVEDAYLK